MKNETFYKEIYEPYNEAYALLKMIKDCGHDNSDDLWAEFATKTEEFVKKHDTDIGHSIARMITDVADSIADINGKEREGKKTLKIFRVDLLSEI